VRARSVLGGLHHEYRRRPCRRDRVIAEHRKLKPHDGERQDASDSFDD